MKAFNQEMVIDHPIIYDNNSVHTSGDLESKIISFDQFNDTYRLLILIKSIEPNNFRVFIERSRLTICVSVNKSFLIPVYKQYNDCKYKEIFHYEILRHVVVWLPADNFYLVRQFLYVEEGKLKLILKESENRFA